jgi:predicted metal-dependent hydrolase
MAKVFAFLGRRSARFGVAFAAGFETIAYAGARWIEPRIGSLFRGADDEPTRLFLWHLAEEVEHKGVAFDIWTAVDGRRHRYITAMIVAAIVLAAFSFAGTLCLLWGRRRLFSPVAHSRLLLWSVTFVFEAVTAMILSCLPGHHPDDFTDPTYLTDWLKAEDDYLVMPSAAVSEPL